MAYCTLTNLKNSISEDQLIQLTDDDDHGEIDTDKIDAAIAKADSKINGYCGKKYSVPFVIVPDVVRDLSVDIAVYNLFSRRGAADGERRDQYQDAIKFLEGVASGKNSLGENDPDGSPAETHRPDISSSDRIFSRSNMDGF